MNELSPEHIRVRDAALTDHANCAFLDPASFATPPCTVCGKPILTLTLVSARIGIYAGFAGLLVGAVGTALAMSFF